MKLFLCAALLVFAGNISAEPQSLYVTPETSTEKCLVAENSSHQPQTSASMFTGEDTTVAYQFVRYDGIIVSNICNTPYGSCVMNGYFPIVGTCWCANGYGGFNYGTPGG